MLERNDGQRPSEAFKRYYEDELAFLREMGAEFSSAYPGIARELGLGGHDPDVERLLQGVAFLCGRIRQTMDAEFPELLYPLLGHIFPQALRPAPCAVVLEFKPRPNMFRGVDVLKAGAEVLSIPVDGTACRFRTAYETPLLPLTVEQVRSSVPGAGQALLTVALRALPGATFPSLFIHPEDRGKPSAGTLRWFPLRLYLHGASISGMSREAFGLFGVLDRNLRAIRLRILDGKGALLGERRLAKEALRSVGREPAEALLPYPNYAFTGYRHLVEYFLFPSKYLFFDLHFQSSATGSQRLMDGLPQGEQLELIFELGGLSCELPSVSRDHIHVNCVPAVNLFQHTACPIEVDGTRSEYLLRPDGNSSDHYDVFSVEHVAGHVRRSSQPIAYHPFFSFYRPSASVFDKPAMYLLRLRQPVAPARSVRDDLPAYQAAQAYLSFVTVAGDPTDLSALVSVDLLCTNRDLPLRLGADSINRPTSDIPSTVQFTNLGPISTPAPAPVGGDGLWRFFAHLQVGLNQFRDRDTFRTMLQLFHLPARYNQGARQKLEALLESIADVSAAPQDQVLGRPPTLIRGTEVRLSVHETRFAHYGELVLFGRALDHFLSEAAAANTYSQLRLTGIDQGTEIVFSPRVGTQRLI